ncbi:DUF2780 domain-containing protein [Vibrio sp. LaRot3]|uniref:DUF2780 domain-containing protein n=1 Tax=Vibrio sp. LaRot3 TaxID=2998829 RepID=UPI0022CDF15C|nr:DUF2780 domain-containing protein [Vibrio sp. LaRot3]MDA0149511.1 DUF2780 domain-containing protein [Vibrio sp. LaRot3]
MKKTLLAVSLVIFSSHSFAFGDLLKDSDSTKGLTDMVSDSLTGTSQSPLTNLLTDQLSISGDQATAGSGALLALAGNQLSPEYSNELQSLIPGMSELSSAQNLLGGIENLGAVQSAFSKVGLDPSMISQFAPLILQYLGDGGASEGLLGSLSQLWQPAS